MFDHRAASEATTPRSGGSATEAWAERHPQAAALDAARPGPELASALASLEPTDLDEAALLEAIAAWERVASWASARQAALITELTRRSTGSFPGGAADAVAARLAVSGRSGELFVERALALSTFPAVHDALDRGDLDVRKATALLRETDHLTPADAQAVQGAVLDGAPGLTVPQLRAAIRRAELLTDPRAAERRCRAARRERFVRLEPAPDAMAWVHAFLPAEDAVTVVTAVDALAVACEPDDDRSIDARRADALVGVLRAVVDSGTSPSGTPLPARRGRRPHLAVTVNASTLAGLDDLPGVLAGYGPIPAEVARRVAADAAWSAVAAHPSTGELAARSTRTFTLPGRAASPPADSTPPPDGAPPPDGTPSARSSTGYRPDAELARHVIDRDVTCTFPGCRVPSGRCDLDHIDPFDPSRPAEEQTTAENLHALCRHHHRLKTFAGWRPVRDPVTGITTWTSPTGHVYSRAPVQLDPASGWSPGHRTGGRGDGTGRIERAD